MRNVLKAAAAMLLVAAVAVTSLAATSPAKVDPMNGYDQSSSSSGGSSGGGGGGSSSGSGSSGVVLNTTSYSGPAQSQTPATAESPAAGGESVSGNWTETNGVWRCNVGGSQLASQWKSVANPYVGGTAQWFYFDAAGNMVTGWQWIRHADGTYHCYYFNPTSNGSKGAAQLGGTTPDGYQLNGNGEWVVNGVVQTK